MTTDRELLEMAAKAAGLRLTWDYRAVSCGDNQYYREAYPKLIGRMAEWNPLLLDGDAFRLMCRLRLAVDVDDSSGMVSAVIEDGIVSCTEPAKNHDDIDSAIRRAIVRAAAEIGRAMP